MSDKGITEAQWSMGAIFKGKVEATVNRLRAEYALSEDELRELTMSESAAQRIARHAAEIVARRQKLPVMRQVEMTNPQTD